MHFQCAKMDAFGELTKVPPRRNSSMHMTHQAQGVSATTMTTATTTTNIPAYKPGEGYATTIQRVLSRNVAALSKRQYRYA